MVSAVQALVAQCEDLKMKYNEEQVKRRKLHNQVEDAKGNIRVFCRCRPLSKSEASAGYSTVVDFDTASNGELGILNSGSTKKTLRFDRVFTPNDNQVDVFAQASPLVTSVLDGYNVCVFAYGQTGTGKTFTMHGTEGNRGVNYRTLEEFFKIAKERIDTFTYNISVSVLEVYNEQIRDLFSTSSASSKNGTENSNTTITWKDGGSIFDSPTLSILANDFVARYLTIQDTLLDDYGRHYYNNCYIEGATNFICENVATLFEEVDGQLLEGEEDVSSKAMSM